MSRRPGRPSKSERGSDAKESILEAARAEFAQAGFSGARIKRIAERAGYDRSLVYAYFGSKARLFQATLDEAARNREGRMPDQPMGVAEGLVYWFRENWDDPDRIRLIMQEALTDPGLVAPPKERRAYLEKQLQVVRAFQDMKLVRDDIDPRHVLMLVLALTSFPACFPRTSGAALGVSPDGVGRRWEEALRELAGLLAGERG
jgi:AcrR family transcriptional regulator